uniref:Ribosomal protein L2 n=1 Tax=Tsukubamonas globosa TaxID=875863 RepID=W8VJU7_9EUKA|nr:ribosomal protein L2 [Tsukubamonas globosa]BAO51950.1 ribosomal protein L2 [Tsukubamonas globosa]
MILKAHKPITPSLRQTSLVDKAFLWKGSTVKKYKKALSYSFGRDSHGHITVRHKERGSKHLYRSVHFNQTRLTDFFVTRIEYDPNRSAFIALIQQIDNNLSYILAPRGLKVGDFLQPYVSTQVKAGNILLLNSVPIGSMIHNIQFTANKKAQLVRSAGCYAQLITRNKDVSLIRLPSGERRYISNQTSVSLGAVSNISWGEQNLGKAGRVRWLGIRPSVRGVAMNPVDHPHGGGEGKTAAGRHPVSLWGKLTKGKKHEINVYIMRLFLNVDTKNNLIL